ncbi:MAG: phosphatase PAP2 family protein [Ktedonobacterales bacterium]|nr:phosphatase PAP2 family protein [Ktedonobacterales bacterium]
MDMGLDQKIAKALSSRRTAIARWISIIIHPVAFPLFTLGILTYTADPAHAPLSAARWVVIALLLTTVPVSLLVGYQVLRGHWSDLDVSVRRQRYILYPFGLVCMIALSVVFIALGAPRIAVGAAIAIAIANIANGLINFFYKVSAHAAGAAMCAALLWAGAPDWAAPATLAAALVGWSRVALGRHTTGQVLLGWAVGVASVAVVLLLPWPTRV